MGQSLLMLSFALTLALTTLAPPAPGALFDGPVDVVKPEIAAARVAACGFKSVRPIFDETLQETVVHVSDLGPASTMQLQCVARASLHSHYYVTFPEPTEQTYQALYWRMSRERDKADAKAWLERRGLLSRLPVYDPKRSDEAAFARSLEKLCGPQATGTLKPMGGMATFEEGALGGFEKGEQSAGKLDEVTFWCLVNAASASGYSVGFIGTETHRQKR
jgi:hypothetical protein